MLKLTYFILLLLCGCSTLNLKPIYPKDPLQALNDWQLQGRLSLRAQNAGISANLFWQQAQDSYRIKLLGPFGIGQILLQGNTTGVKLKNARGQTFTAITPESLLQQQLGWQLPLANLHYWIRGLAAPNLPAKQRVNSNQCLIFLQQQGWNISYLSYQNINGLALPARIYLVNPQLQVNIIIDHWEFAPVTLPSSPEN